MRDDRVIYELRSGRMTRTEELYRTSALHRNFLIICAYGDWSGFRTLQECEDQIPELERSNRPDRYYQIIERL